LHNKGCFRGQLRREILLLLHLWLCRGSWRPRPQLLAPKLRPPLLQAAQWRQRHLLLQHLQRGVLRRSRQQVFKVRSPLRRSSPSLLHGSPQHCQPSLKLLPGLLLQLLLLLLLLCLWLLLWLLLLLVIGRRCCHRL
jgi:hypothetical protein